MKKLEILRQIADIMNSDAACCKDKKDVALSKYELLIDEEMSDNEFLLLVNSYLATFGVTGHLFFKKQGHKGLPFRVHRYEDILYVVEVTKGSPLCVGDKIVLINGGSVKEFYERYAECFFCETQERQTPYWNFLLKYTNQMGYVRASEDVAYWDVELFDWINKDEPYIYKKIDDSISYLRFEDFVDYMKISSLLEEHDSELQTTKNLVIDVRGNGGGNSFSYEPLLKYCLPNGKKLSDLDMADNILQYGQEILYSERNCDVRIEIIEEMMCNNSAKREDDVLKQAVNVLRDLRGKGFVKETEAYDSDVIGDSDVENVFILTDSCCCSAGDMFVDLFKMFPKVKVFGRTTQGILDYSNVAYALFDEYALVYPTSRLLALDYGKGMMGQGVAVDEYIAWTPAHLIRDVDLEYVKSKILLK